ncbi:sigma-70 family RNA polymerase sigma factor [Coleofasciculus sp. LEGE 07092]|nr:sigma-70 family RNA polymerase sigma factor [Coleofasciculus sp. LEGE 07081]MBE9128033.1 sigma-70 family RNA polymerase sigma factor [Coleofasciculus sp. LEGE 07081]MBE9151130.1 sigma-70 family RNA polymerase sigma factor [Coleofasciculus sp. LEGE 07092]
MNPIDERLKQLAREAQRHPPKTPQRRLALAKLLSAIQQSRKLTRPYQGQFQGFYEDIYDEAKQRLFCHICEKIDDYDPNREVLQWVNFLLKQRFFIEASRTILPTTPKGIDPKKVSRLTLDDLDRKTCNELNPQLNPSLSQDVLQCLESDPEGVFKGTYTSDNPAANFQFLAIKLLSGYSWKEISEELGIKISTLSSFYQRCLTKFAPKFREYLS